jgi:hypothetical protein
MQSRKKLINIRKFTPLSFRKYSCGLPTVEAKFMGTIQERAREESKEI